MALRAVLGEGADGLVLAPGSVTADRARPGRRTRVRARRGGRGDRARHHHARRAATCRDPDALADRGRGDRRDGGVHPRRSGRARSRRDERGDRIRALRRLARRSRSPRSRACAPRCRSSGSSITGFAPSSPARRRRRPRHDPADRRSARVSPIPTPPTGWREAADRAVARGRRVDRFLPFLLDSPISHAGYVYGTAVGWIWGSLWSTGRVEKRAGLWVFRGMPRWAFPPRRRVRRAAATSPATTPSPTACCAHEAVHARQWRRYGFLMPLLYLLAGRDPLRNRFEIEAGLEDGNYVPRARAHAEAARDAGARPRRVGAIERPATCSGRGARCSPPRRTASTTTAAPRVLARLAQLLGNLAPVLSDAGPGRLARIIAAILEPREHAQRPRVVRTLVSPVRCRRPRRRKQRRSNRRSMPHRSRRPPVSSSLHLQTHAQTRPITRLLSVPRSRRACLAPREREDKSAESECAAETLDQRAVASPKRSGVWIASGATPLRAVR